MRNCPKCGKDVDPRAPLCQCGDDLVPPFSYLRYVGWFFGASAFALIVLIVLDVFGIISL